MKKVKLAGVVVLYNPECDIKKNICSYLDEVDKLYVIDNSNKKNLRVLPKSNKIEYIYYGENKGIAFALDDACRRAINDKYNWILTMDQDSYFTENNLSVLKENLNNIDKNVGILSPYHHTKLNEPKCAERYDNPCGVITSGNILNLNVYQNVGGFKTWLFIDGVDIEYCLNIRKQGYIILRDNSSVLEHNLGDIFYGKLFGKQVICTNHNYIRRYYIMRNDHYIYDMYKDFDLAYSSSTRSQKDAILGIIFFEKGKIKKLFYSIKGYIHYKKNIRGKLK